MTSEPVAYYPLFADLRGRRCVVIGGGLIAQRKVTTLLRFGAAVTVVSPMLTKRLAAYVRQRRIRHLARRFRLENLRGAWLVYAATDDQRINELVYRSATKRQILTNVVDQKPLCSFIAPAIVKRGDLVIAISTGGGSPALAKKLRRDLDKLIGADYAEMLRLLKGLRGAAKQQLPSYQDRKRYFDHVVTGRVFHLIRSGKRRAARREALALLQQSARNGAPPAPREAAGPAAAPPQPSSPRRTLPAPSAPGGGAPAPRHPRPILRLAGRATAEPAR